MGFRQARVFLALVSLSVAVAGCGHKDETLIGKWQYSTTVAGGKAYLLTYDFRPDGTATETRAGRVTTVIEETYMTGGDEILTNMTRATVNGRDISLVNQGHGVAWTFKIDGDRLTLTDKYNPATKVTMRRVKP